MVEKLHVPLRPRLSWSDGDTLIGRFIKKKMCVSSLIPLYQLILKYPFPMFFCEGERGETLLHWSARHGLTNFASALLNLGKAPGSRGRGPGCTPCIFLVLVVLKETFYQEVNLT